MKNKAIFEEEGLVLHQHNELKLFVKGKKEVDCECIDDTICKHVNGKEIINNNHMFTISNPDDAVVNTKMMYERTGSQCFVIPKNGR